MVKWYPYNLNFYIKKNLAFWGNLSLELGKIKLFQSFEKINFSVLTES